MKSLLRTLVLAMAGLALASCDVNSVRTGQDSRPDNSTGAPPADANAGTTPPADAASPGAPETPHSGERGSGTGAR